MIFTPVSLFHFQQLSFRIVALCNHLTRIMKKGNKLPEQQDEVRDRSSLGGLRKYLKMKHI